MDFVSFRQSPQCLLSCKHFLSIAPPPGSSRLLQLVTFILFFLTEYVSLHPFKISSSSIHLLMDL